MEPNFPPPQRNTAVIIIIALVLVGLLFGKQIKAYIDKLKMNSDASSEAPPSNSDKPSGSTGSSNTPKTTPPAPPPSKENPAPPKPSTTPKAEDCSCSSSFFFGDKNYLGDSKMPRSMRNNNPGNIRRGSTAWKCKIPHSEVQNEYTFEQFRCYKYGVRAMIKQVLELIRRGHNSVYKLVAAWDTGDNDKDYVDWVIYKTRLTRDEIIKPTDKQKIRQLIKAMAQKESGSSLKSPQGGHANPITDQDFDLGWALL
jgi:hypothetical protein